MMASATVGGVMALSHRGKAHASDSDAARIMRIEYGLRPRIVIKGEVAPPSSMRDRMAHYAVPGVSLAFFDAHRILWTRQYGVTDAAAPRPVTAETIFQASSISKMTTAAGVLRLVRGSALALDEDVNLKLKRWKVPANAFTREQKVTVRRLLSHSAGTTVHGTGGYVRGAPLPTLRQILDGAPPADNPAVEVAATPGSDFRYSGGGYLILQQLVEDVTGEPFAETMHRLVLRPADMSHSTYAQPLPDRLLDQAAHGHSADGAPLPGGASVFPETAPAGLWSTPSDLARFAMELNREAEGRSDRILDRTLAREMLTRQAGGWGLGVDLAAATEEPRFSHSGTNPGYQSFLIFFPERKEGLAVMTNGANQSGFVYEIVMAVAEAYGWPGFRQVEETAVDVAPAVLDGYVGTWLADGAPAFEVKRAGDKLVVLGGPFGPRAVELYARSQTQFFILSTGFVFDFAEAAQDKALLGGGIRAVRTRRP